MTCTAVPTTEAQRTPGGRRPRRGSVAAATLALALGSGLFVVGTGSSSATDVPPTPAGLPVGVEALQPYVGQAGCDPVAKPGVVAFQRLLMSTYRDTGSLGIVRDCGIGGQSEHKEGRAFDWAVSVNDPSNVVEVQTVTDWLTATVNGVPAANARRLGLMYMIWNHRIWKSYQMDRGWQAYTGPVPHTDHVHFSFGWNGAKQATSWWTGNVAPVDYGPYADGPPETADPDRSPANLYTLARWGTTTLSEGSTGDAVRVVQAALEATVDGDYGPATSAKVRDFQTAQGMPVTGTFGPPEWLRLFPKPVAPFGNIDQLTTSGSGTRISGWALDADTTAPIAVHVYVDAVGTAVTAGLSRTDLATPYPGVGTAHGFDLTLPIGDGRHAVCVYGIDVGEGANTLLGCRTVLVQHTPIGNLEVDGPTSTGYRVAGWTFDPDAPTTSIPVHVYVDGTGVPLTADGPRSDVAAVYPAAGAAHGFSYDFSMADGRHQICVYGINTSGLGGTETLTCQVVVVARNPRGSMDSATAVPGGVAVSGWAFDPDAAATSSAVHVYVDGRGTALVADGSRPDIAAAFPAAGAAHGFSVILPQAAGSHQVCSYAINSGAGVTTVLGCRTVVVR